MRHTSEILKELGFNKDAPESTKEALIRHLERAAVIEKSTFSTHAPGEQLSFNFDEPIFQPKPTLKK